MTYDEMLASVPAEIVDNEWVKKIVAMLHASNEYWRLGELGLLDAVRIYVSEKQILEKLEEQGTATDMLDEQLKKNIFLNREAVNKAWEQLVQAGFREMNILREVPQQEFKALENVRDLLGKGMVPLAIKYIEDFVANDDALGKIMDQFPYLGAFEQSFKTAMRKHNLIAGFVVVELIKKPDNTYSYKMITGGHHIADAVLAFHLRPLAEKLGKDIGPKRDYLEIADIVRRGALNSNENDRGRSALDCRLDGTSIQGS
jgi:hypothetical protein